jgi:hypothetical protein
MDEIGPVQYAVVAFPGTDVDPRIASSLADLVRSGTIRMIDLAFVRRDAHGAVQVIELDEIGEATGFGELGVGPGGWLNQDDLEAAGEELEPDNSAAVLVWEDAWAARFASAVRDAGGVLLDHDRIPHEVVVTARDWASEHVETGSS